MINVEDHAANCRMARLIIVQGNLLTGTINRAVCAVLVFIYLPQAFYDCSPVLETKHSNSKRFVRKTGLQS